MILLKNTTNNQIFYIIHKKMYGKSDGYGLTTLDVEYTENGQYSINPPSGYDGLSSVNVTVDVENGDCNLTTSTVTITGDGEHTITPPEGYDGFSEVVVNVESDCEDAYEEGVADQKAKLASATFTENGSYNREDGWNTVQVNVDTVTPYNEGVEDGKDAQKALMTSLTAVSNGTYTREDGYNEVVVNVPSDVNNQNKQVTYTQNGTQTVLADSGYSGLGQVQVSVNVDTVTPYNNGKQDGIDEQKSKMISGTFTQNGTFNREDGYNQVVIDVDTVTPYNNGKQDGINEQKAKLTDITIVSNGHYSREDGYDDITVNVPSDINNQNKQITYTQNGTQTIVADNGYSGLGQVAVTVNVDTVTPYNNGFEDGVADQKSKLTTGTFTSNGTYVRPDGYNEVVINIPSDVHNQNKTVNPSTSQQVITANQGYSGLGQVTVNAVTAAIDPDIRPENILEGVDILGVVGTNKGYDNGYDDGYAAGQGDCPSPTFDQLDETITENGSYSYIPEVDGFDSVDITVNVQPDLETKTATYVSNNTYTITPTTGKDGISQATITVNVPSDVHNQNKTVSPSVSQQTVTADNGYSGLGTVTVNAVTSAIDSDIRPENIKKDVEILGVTGTYDPQPDLEAKTATYTTNGTYSVVPSAGKDGLSGVEVTVNVDTQTPYDNGYADGEADQKAKLTTLTVTQNGTYTRADGYDEVVVNVQCGGSTLYVNPTSINTELNGGTYTIDLYSSDPWTITNEPNWVTLSQSSGNSGIYSITVTIPSNSDDRSGSFTISNGSDSVVVSISQARNYGNEYLTFEAFDGARTIHWITGNPNVTRSIDYSFDGVTWTTLTSEYKQNGLGYETGFRIPYKGKVYVRGNMDKVWDNASGNGCRFYDAGGTGDRYKVYGNIMSLLNGDNFAGTNLTSSNQYAFKRLFAFNGAIAEAYGLVLPNNTQPHCYEEMFYQTASSQRMYGMPNLPATVMTDYCYYGMFEGCSITGKPVLPSTQLAPYCYSHMFDNANLGNAPDLPATTLAEGCYSYMFRGCRFSKAPDLLAETLVPYCYTQMFSECSSLNSIKCLATNKSATDCTKYWVANVSSSGTFTKAASASWTSGSSGSPQYWVVQNA